MVRRSNSQAGRTAPLATLLAAAFLLLVVVVSAAEIRTLDVCEPTPEHPRNDHQLIFPLRDGRLMLVWCEYYTDASKPAPDAKPTAQRDEMPCRISAKTSSDGGRTWGATFVLQENSGRWNVKHPNLLRLPSGEVLFFYTEWNSRTERVVYVRRSTDDCKTWGPPRRVSAPAGITNINNDHVLQLRTGRILLPAFFSQVVGDPADHFQAFCFISDDDGQTWQSSESKLALPKRGAEEPSVVELKDGTLLAALRTSLGSVYLARSTNAGVTWSEPVSCGLAAPASPPLLKRIPTTGDLLLIWNQNYEPNHHHQGERSPLCVAISRDEGGRWEHIKDIERVPGGAAAYAAVAFVREEALVTYYYQSRGFGGLSGVRLKTIPLAWFYE